MALSARLAMEREGVEATVARSARATLRWMSPDGLLYEIGFHVRTLVRGDDGIVREEEREVPVAYDLAPSHPLIPPVAVALQRDLFNPHVHDPRRPSALPPLPVICLGGFRPEHRLADWLPATYYLLAYARIAPGHGLNPEAVAWARRELGRGRFPIDPRPFSEPVTVRPAGESTR